VYMLRGLTLLLLALLIAFLALPFLLTSRALEAHGITIPGRVYHKSEYVKVLYSGWDLSRDITIEFTVPETSSVTFFDVHPDAQQYDSLHTKQTVDVRYLLRKDVPQVPGSRFLLELHALRTASLANMHAVSRLDALRTPSVVLSCEIIAGIITLLALWRITRWRLFAWAAGIGTLPLVALILLQGFPRPTLAPTRGVRQAAGRVKSIGRIDKLFSGSRSRGVIAEQPVDVVSVEFVPEGRVEPVVAVDLIDRGSIRDLKEQSTVTLDYEADSPRTAYIDGATRRFPERNLSGVMTVIVLYLGVTIIMLAAVYWFGRGYKRLVSRSN
jgi:hypothetical protein